MVISHYIILAIHKLSNTLYYSLQVLTAANHEGSHWVRIEQEKESKIIFKWVSNKVCNAIGLSQNYTAVILFYDNVMPLSARLNVP